MRRGVNARLTSLRMIVCRGGSMKMISSCCQGPRSSPIISSTVPWAELNVSASIDASYTSSNRLSAQKSYSSLR
jgi:hypothetical protein